MKHVTFTVEAFSVNFVDISLLEALLELILYSYSSVLPFYNTLEGLLFQKLSFRILVLWKTNILCICFSLLSCEMKFTFYHRFVYSNYCVCKPLLL